MTIDLDDLEAKARAATPHNPPGDCWVAGIGCVYLGNPTRRCAGDPDAPDTRFIGCSDADAEFIAAARSAVPELIAEVRRLTAERDAALALLRDVVNHWVGES